MKQIFTTILIALCVMTYALTAPAMAQELKLKPLNEVSKQNLERLEKAISQSEQTQRAVVSLSNHFICDRQSCTCDSADDCSDMLETNVCGQPIIFACGTTTCSCLRRGNRVMSLEKEGLRDQFDRILPPR